MENVVLKFNGAQLPEGYQLFYLHICLVFKTNYFFSIHVIGNSLKLCCKMTVLLPIVNIPVMFSIRDFS